MDNFKAFQLSTEEAMNVTGEGRGGRRGGGMKRFLKGLSEADQTAVKTAITELKATDGWADLAKEDKRAQIKAIVEPYKV